MDILKIIVSIIFVIDCIAPCRDRSSAGRKVGGTWHDQRSGRHILGPE